jgi:hypothetical protein
MHVSDWGAPHGLEQQGSFQMQRGQPHVSVSSNGLGRAIRDVPLNASALQMIFNVT